MCRVGVPSRPVTAVPTVIETIVEGCIAGARKGEKALGVYTIDEKDERNIIQRPEKETASLRRTGDEW